MSNELVDYLKLVATEDVGAWINIHHTWWKPGMDKPSMPGHGHQTIRTAIRDALYWANRGWDVYMGQNVYTAAVPPRGNFPYHDAIRLDSNLSMCRCLYIDVDVKDNAYTTSEDARAAIGDFIRSARLPTPSCVVSSGTGGMHVYWAMVDLFEPKEFRRRAPQLVNAALANGLKFDTQCTMDPVRLLRPPGTWNFKRGDPALPVSLIYKGKRIDNALMWAALDQFSDQHSSSRRSRPRHEMPPPGQETSNDELIGGMETQFPPVDIDKVLCPFIKDTLANGGADLRGNPDWHMVVHLASFCIDGRAVAHRLCQGNEWYVPEGTDQEYDRVEQQKAQRAPGTPIGPHRCASVQMSGKHQCGSCTFRAQNSTPLLYTGYQTNGHAYLNDLPPGYFRGKGDHIYVNLIDDDDPAADHCVFPYPIVPGSGFMGQGKFTFVTKLQSGVKEITFMASIVAEKVGYHRALLEKDMPIGANLDRSKVFMTSYLSLLRSNASTFVNHPAFGWDQDDIGQQGFAFANKFISSTAVERCAPPPAGVEEFKIEGGIDVWKDLAKVVLAPERPDLCCLTATSFAAPLLRLLDCEGVMVGAWSSESGVGKTTAMKLGQAVWGRPKMGGMEDTVNYVFAKCAALRHLPVYHDEIKGEKQIEGMCQLAFSLTRGKNKGRLNRDSSMRPSQDFDTMFVYASNASLVNEVRDHHRGTDADFLRMFELRALDTLSGQYSLSAVQQLVGALNNNHGGVGLLYAEMLGRNYAAIRDRLKSVQDMLQAQWAIPNDHRFWLAALASILVGAHLANRLGVCQFPVDDMGRFLFTEYNFMRDELSFSPNDYSKERALTNTISAFLNEMWPRNTIVLDKTWSQPSRPPKSYAKVLNERPDAQWGRLSVQISGDPLTLRISDTILGDWCAKTQRPKSALTTGMRKKFGAKLTTTVIGSGSKRAGGAENAWVITVKGTPLEFILEHAIHHNFLPP